MNFLSPWFLLGVAAVIGPILFHLIRRVVRERMLFSSLMFLNPTPARVTRRGKLDNLLLLFLRCLCLLLLALGFARPFFGTDDVMPRPNSEERQIILLVDTSASMQREGLWTRARALAEKYLAKTLPGDQVAIVTFDRQPRTLVSFSEWSEWSADQRAAMAQQRLAATSPGWMGTHLGLGLTSAAELFVNDSTNGEAAVHRELVLITDLQEGSKLDGLQGYEWPPGVSIIIECVKAKQSSNAGLEILSDTGTVASDGDEVHVRVANARDSSLEKFQLFWSLSKNEGPAGEPLGIYLSPGQIRNFTAPKLALNSRFATLSLTGDEAAFDNRSFYVAPESEHVTLAWFGSESSNDPANLRYYLQRVFSETPRQKVEIVSLKLHAVFSPALLNQSSFAVIPNRLSPEEILATHDWLTRGKTALLVLTDVQMGPTLAALAGLPEIQVSEAVGDFALLGEIDFSHPLFAPFADPRFSDFTHIHFWKHRHLEIPATAQVRVLAKFDDGSPALLQLTVGRGNLLVLASGWNPTDSQLAVSSKFPPLMQTLLDWSGGAAPTRSQFLTGDAIPSPAGADATVEWQKPDGKKLLLAGVAPFTETDLPGIYVATFGGKGRRYAVNLSLDESRTAPLSPDELAQLGVPLQTVTEVPVARIQERQHHLQQAELENRQKLWRWLILGVLAVMLVEIVLGGRLARRVKTTGAIT